MSPSIALAALREPGRPAQTLRRDAGRNLDAILAAARDLIAEHGYDVSMEQIACRAGVGVGTLYRRFPSKDDLVDSVVAAVCRRTVEIADEVLEGTSSDEAVFEFLRRCVAEPGSSRVLSAAPRRTVSSRVGVVPEVARRVETMLEAAKRAGQIRRDAEFGDVALVLMSVRAVADRCEAFSPGAALRHLEVCLDGLRPARDPLAPGAISLEQLSAAIAGA